MPVPDWLKSIKRAKPEIDFDAISYTGQPDFIRALNRFIEFNTQGRSPLNTNDILFIEWILRMFPENTECSIADVRANVGIMACNHSRLISGENYITFEEREEALRKEFNEKMRKGEYNTPVRYLVVPDSKESMADAVMRTWRQEKSDMLKNKHEILAAEHALELARRPRGTNIVSELTLETLMAQVATVVREHWMTYSTGENFPLTPSHELMKDIDYLGNQAQGAQQGEFLSYQPVPWLSMLTHTITHLYLEHWLLGRWPSMDSALFDESKFQRWVSYCYSRDVPQAVCKQIREDVCNFITPAGAKTFCTRFLNRSIVPPDAIVQHCIGTNAVAEILASVDDEIKIKQIADNPKHHLYDVICMSAVAWHSQQMDGFEFDIEVMMTNSDLIQCHSNLLMTEVYGKPRRPLIIYMNGWKVHHAETWFNTESFTQSWLLWLNIMTTRHNSTTAHDCDISELCDIML